MIKRAYGRATVRLCPTPTCMLVSHRRMVRSEEAEASWRSQLAAAEQANQRELQTAVELLRQLQAAVETSEARAQVRSTRGGLSHASGPPLS